MQITNILMLGSYWVLIALWAIILGLFLKHFRYRKLLGATVFLLLVVLSIDAFRTLFESIFFGLYFNAKAEVLPVWLYDFLNKPGLILLPKAINILAALLVLFLLLRSVLPRINGSINDAEQSAQFLLDHSGDAFFFADANNGKIINANQQACDYLGYDREEMLTMHVPDFSMPIEKFRRVVESFEFNQAYTVETEHRHKNGKLIPVEIRSRRIKTRDGERIISLARDISERLVIESKLKASEKRFWTLAEAAPMGLYETNAEGECLYVNAKWRDFAGLSTDEALGRGWQKGLYIEDRDRIFQTWNESAAAGEPWECEYRFCTPDGKITWVIGTAAELLDDEGQITGYLGANLDISERKEAQLRIEESEEKYRNLVETAQELVWQCDATGNFTYLNPAWEKTTGYMLEEMLGRNFGDFQTPEIHKRDLKEFAKYLAGGMVSGYETEYLSKEGNTLTLLFNAIPITNAEGKITGTQGTAIDITASKHATEELRNNQSELARRLDLSRALASLARNQLSYNISLDQIAESILIHAKRLSGAEYGYVSEIDPETGTNIGFNLTCMMGKECLVEGEDKRVEFFPDEQGKYGKLWGHALNSSEGFFTNDPVNHPKSEGVPEGHIPLKNFISVPVISNQKLLGQIAMANSRRDFIADDLEALERIADLYAIAIVRDRANRRMEKVEASLHQAQKMETVGQLTGGVAHDFNNLLQVIQGNLELLQMKAENDDESLGLIDAAASAVKRGAKLTQQLLAFSRAQTLEPDLINVNEMIEGMLKLLKRTLGENIEIEAILADKIPNIMVDSNKLQNAILNLALNSKAAMPVGGRLAVSSNLSQLKKDKQYDNFIIPAGDYVTVGMEDFGTGMTPETISRAVEPFFTTKEVGEGSGLGLSMIYGFVKQSGGHLIIESEPAKGTKVSMVLPISDTPPNPAPDENTQLLDKQTVESATILLVEDDHQVRQTVAMLIENMGYRVIEADNAVSALAILKNESEIDLLFSDIVMPRGISGLELATSAVKNRLALKVLLTSGYPDSELAHLGQSETQFDLLKKPYTKTELEEALVSALS